MNNKIHIQKIKWYALQEELLKNNLKETDVNIKIINKSKINFEVKKLTTDKEDITVVKTRENKA